ncbi:phage scaffolding protein [Chakrabartyella piscis]|uniref:phage scaffolding protein n=1 Tax=Chakrabartyella piscis TaxID=2918914 RepID=UPI002958B6D6|nr:phage scaffolding protein [Chakrabartyella piscis]
MTLMELEDMGIGAEACQKIWAALEESQKGKEDLETQLRSWQEELLAEKEAKEAKEREQYIDRLIMEAGGKNATAIRALLADGDLLVDESGKVDMNLDGVRIIAPYLFQEKEEKIDGTGYRFGKKSENDIMKAFKSGMRR